MLKTYGNPSHPPLVLLHGFLGSHLDWLETVVSLEKHWYCIVPDLPGHGDRIELEPVDEVLEHIQQQILHLVKQPYHLLGYSLGGRIAMKFAFNAPYSVASLCLESAHPGLMSEFERQQRQASDKTWADRFRHEPLSEVLMDWYKQPVFANLSNKRLQRLIAQHKKQSPVPLAQTLVWLGLGRQFPYWNFLQQWAKPLLYISGAYDAKFTAIGEQVQATCPSAQHVVLDNAAHNSHWDQPEHFNEVVTRFLNNTVIDNHKF